MTRKLDILNQDYRFLNSEQFDNGKYYLSYKLVICNAVFKYLKNADNDFNLREELCQLRDSILKNGNRSNELFSIYSLNVETDGILFFDHQKGCYPLLIVNKKNNNEDFDEVVLRKSAVEKSLNQMIESAEELHLILAEHSTDWSNDIQEKIINLCPDPVDA